MKIVQNMLGNDWRHVNCPSNFTKFNESYPVNRFDSCKLRTPWLSNATILLAASEILLVFGYVANTGWQCQQVSDTLSYSLCPDSRQRPVTMSLSSYDELLKQVASLKVENTSLRQELQDNSSHLTKLESEASSMKDVLTHLQVTGSN